jgi:hypothetical protein
MPERRFDVTPLVVVAQVVFPIETKQVEHLLEESADVAGRIRLERCVKSTADFGHGIEVFAAGVGSI